MAFIKTKAIVIACKNVSDVDKIVTLFTPSHGLIEAVAKGAKRIRSPLSGATQQFTYGEFDLYYTSDRNYYSINNATIISSFLNLTGNTEKFATATYMTKLIYSINNTSNRADEQVLLLASALYVLNKAEDSFYLIRRIYEFKFLCLEGYMPELVNCTQCGKPVTDDEFVFFNDETGIICSDCCGKKGRKIHKSTVNMLRYVASVEVRKIFSFKVNDVIFDEINYIIPMLYSKNVGIDVNKVDFIDLFS